jgi:hypothetical protein
MRGEIIWNKGGSAGPSTAWGSWKSATNPTLRDVHEYILVFSKGSFSRKPPEERPNTIGKEQFLEYTKSVWTLQAESARKVGHPAPFPVELPLRLIQLYTFAGEVVLDPFMGSDQNDGITAPVATLQRAYDIGREGKNDVVALIGNGLTTATARLNASFTWAKNAFHMIGLSSASRFSQRSRIAPLTSSTAFTPLITISGSGCMFQNIEFFHGFGTGTTAQICMALSGARNTFINCQISGMGDTTSAASSTSRTMVISADENYFSNCVLGLDTISRGALNATVEFQSGAARTVFEDCLFPALASTAAAALIVLTSSASALDRATYFRRCAMVNASTFSGGSAGTGPIKLAASSGGLIVLQGTEEYGYTDWGYDATSKAQIVVSTAGTTSGSGILIVNT